MNNFFWSYIKTLIDSGGYGMLYNWPCTQIQPSVEYGYLYNWYAATDSRNICSAGWHIPTKAEFDALIAYLGGLSVAGGKLKETGTAYWLTPNTGATNEYGFNLRGGGRRYSDGTFSYLKTIGSMLSSTAYNSSYNYIFNAFQFGADMTQEFGDVPMHSFGLSVRPMKDSTTLTEGETGIYVDPSGIIYPTICIGTQEWVACNIMTKHYRNGDAIPEVTSNTAWAALTTGARCSYNNTEANAGTTKKISSSDSFIVPTKTIWENFFNSLDTYDSEINGWPLLGTKLRESGWNRWYQTFEGENGIEGTDNYKMSLVGGGSRDSSGGYFDGLKQWVQIWSSTDNDEYPYSIYTLFSNNKINISNGSYKEGYAIRLCNPTTTNAEGSVNSYTQNDGTVIPTIVINGVEWTMNLRETKWSDGTDIQNVTDNTAWSLLQEAACCDINNDVTKR